MCKLSFLPGPLADAERHHTGRCRHGVVSVALLPDLETAIRKEDKSRTGTVTEPNSRLLGPDDLMRMASYSFYKNLLKFSTKGLFFDNIYMQRSIKGISKEYFRVCMCICVRPT